MSLLRGFSSSGLPEPMRQTVRRGSPTIARRGDGFCATMSLSPGLVVCTSFLTLDTRCMRGRLNDLGTLSRPNAARSEDRRPD